MVLRIACPTKRRGSENWYFRRRIPTDVQAILAKMPKTQRPRNWYAKHISISLKTADRAAAKSKCPEIAAEVERQLKALREGPKALTAKQVAALSGIAYRALNSWPWIMSSQRLRCIQGSMRKQRLSWGPIS
jgi:uncharacterized protein DUF6538